MDYDAAFEWWHEQDPEAIVRALRATGNEEVIYNALHKFYHTRDYGMTVNPFEAALRKIQDWSEVSGAEQD